MSHFITSRSFDPMASRASARSTAFDWVSDFIAAVIGHIVRRMRQERTRRELLDLDDHMLSDIGLSRLDLRSSEFAELNRINWSGRGHPSGI